MKQNLQTKLAAVAIAAAAMVAVPVAAQAATPSPDYPAVAPGANGQTVAPGGTVTVPFTGFAPNETVTFTLTGENAASATLAVVSASAGVSSTSITKAAQANGAASVSVTLPANARGAYTLAAVGGTSGQTATATITAAARAMPNTGGDPASLAGVWIGGGALLAAGAALTGVTIARRRQAQGA